MVNEYELKISAQDMRLVISALAELPYKVSAGTLQNLIRQTDAQEAAANKPAENKQEEKQ